MREENIILEQYKFIRESLKILINDYTIIKFYGNDIIERVQFIAHLKKKLIKERSEK